MTTESPAFACDLSALPSGGRAELTVLTERLFPAADELRVLADGYELAYFDASAARIADLARFVALDRLCCPFLRHGLVTEPDSSAVRLQLTGPPGAKEAIAADVQRLVRDAAAARVTPSSRSRR